MGSYVFRWPHPANDVHITGTFDDWGKSVALEKKGNVWEKEVYFRSADEKVLYKFVVDDQWITDHTAPQEDDGHWNINNVLYPHQITRQPLSAMGAGVAVISSTAPDSTTAALAGKVPLEKEVPGAYPSTPGTETGSYGVNPIPASAGIGNPITLAPGQAVPPSSTIGSGTIGSSVTTSKEGYDRVGGSLAGESGTYGVNPLPASAGIGNPVNLTPGQAVPHPSTITPHTVGSTVTTSKDDYESAGSGGFFSGIASYIIAGLAVDPNIRSDSATALSRSMEVPTFQSAGPNSTTAKLAAGLAVDPSIRAGATTALNESTFQSAGPSSTTARLAGEVPLEKKRQAMVIDPADAPNVGAQGISSSVPSVVQESVLEAHQPPEALTSPEVVKEKAAVEKEILAGVSSGAAVLGSSGAVATSVPGIVQESVVQAHRPPEALASPEVVREKAAVEQEMLAAVPSGAAAIGSSGALTASVPGIVQESVIEAQRPPEALTSPEVVREKAAVEREMLAASPAGRAAVGNSNAMTSSVPGVVQQSVTDSRQSPEALTSPAAVEEKAAVEQEILAKVHPSGSALGAGPTAVDQSSYHGLATAVPTAVEESMARSDAPPEAAASTSVVAEKSAVEQELLTKVPHTDAAGEPAPTFSAATSATAPGTASTTAATSVPSTAVNNVATSLTDGVTANKTVPDTDTSTATTGATAGELAGGAAAGGMAAAAAAAAAHLHKESNVEPPRVADSVKPPITTERSPAAVSSTVTSDPTLAHEPAVQMMQQNETTTNPTTGAATTPTKPKDSPAKGKAVDETPKASTPVKAAPSEDTKKSAVPVDKANKPSTATPSSGSASTPKAKKTSTAPAAAAAASTPKTTPAATPQTQKTTPAAAASTPGSASATPTKSRLDSGSNASSPAGSTSKEAKKRNRMSRLMHKIFD